MHRKAIIECGYREKKIAFDSSLRAKSLRSFNKDRLFMFDFAVFKNSTNGSY